MLARLDQSGVIGDNALASTSRGVSLALRLSATASGMHSAATAKWMGLVRAWAANGCQPRQSHTLLATRSTMVRNARAEELVILRDTPGAHLALTAS